MSNKPILVASHGTIGARAAENEALARCEAGDEFDHLLVVPTLWRGMTGDDWLNNAATQIRFGNYVEDQLEREMMEEVERLRSMVEATVIWRGQSIRVITVHWKSRLEGTAETLPARAREAAALQRRLSMLEKAGADQTLLVIGDFNADSSELAPLTSVLDDLWISVPPPEQSGSYVYRGRWHSPDRVLISQDLDDGIGLDILPES